MFGGERGGAEVLVHGVQAGEQVGEALPADPGHQRQPDRRVERVAPADPLERREGQLRRDAEAACPIGARRRAPVAEFSKTVVTENGRADPAGATRE